MPKISVIIPVYNTEKYLRKCLDSVLSQTLSDIEVICIDDFSSDNSLKILKEYATEDNRIKIIELKENSGAAKARNLGIDEANGNYLTFLDSDDYPEDDDFYEKLYLKALKTQADIVKGTYKNSDTGFIDKDINNKIKEDKNCFCSTYCSAIFKAGLIKKNNIKFPLLRDMEDPVFAFKCALFADKIEVVDDLNLIVTKREDSITAKTPDFNQIKDKITGLELISTLSKDGSALYPVAFWFITVFLDSVRKNHNKDTEEYLTYKLYNVYNNFKANSEFIRLLKQFSPNIEKYFSKLDDSSVYYFDKEYLKQLIDKVEVVSFDIFDTLLLRPFVNPVSVFLHIERKYSACGFAQERILAEKRARLIKSIRNKTAEDIAYENIYNTIKPRYKEFKQIELDTEMQTLQANEEMLEIFNYAKSKNKKIIITSDMYLTPEFLTSLLNKNGFLGFSKLYVSGEIGKCKCTGNLYEYIFDDLKIKPQNILHIGDNLESDIKQAKSKGYNTFYYKMLKKRFFNAYSNQLYLKLYNKYSAKVSEFIGLQMLYWHKNKEYTDYWQKLGYRYGGPLLLAFVSQINKIVKERNLTDLFFVARDGYLVKKAYEFLFENDNLKTHYIYASRKIKSLCTKTDELYSEKTYNEYIKYVDIIKLKGEKAGIIDTCTGVFSAQSLIEDFFKGKDYIGIYIASFLNYKYNYINLSTTKHGDINTGFSWDFIEFLLSSPEPPIENIENCKPVYRTNLTEDDEFYIKIFPGLEKGMMGYISDMKNIFGEVLDFYTIENVFLYFKEFWNNMNNIDKEMLSKIKHPVDTKQATYVSLLGSAT